MGRVHVAVGIGMPMMLTVMPHPPEGSLLHGATAQASEDELEGSAGLKGVVGEVTVVARRDAEHADNVENCAEAKRRRVHSRPEDGQAGDVE
jgi:hypothetical protein